MPQEPRSRSPDQSLALNLPSAYALLVTGHAQQILEEALALPPDEREALVEALRASLRGTPVTLDPPWRATVHDRLSELESGRVQAVPAHEVEARLRRTLVRR